MRLGRFRSRRRGREAPAGIPLPPLVAEGLRVVEEAKRQRERLARIPGASLPPDATRPARPTGGLHPSADLTGHRARAVLAHWEAVIGAEVPQVAAAWAAEDAALFLLTGPLDPAVGVPRETAKVLGCEIRLRQYGRYKPDKHRQLVLAEVSGRIAPEPTPDSTWATDGLLVPFGHTRAGVLHLPLLGPDEAGPMTLSGAGAAELLSSVVVFALARAGAANATALVYEDLLPYVDGLIEAETFGPADLLSLRQRLEGEWQTRGQAFADADDIADASIRQGATPVPLLLVLIGAQAATDLRLLDPGWPYILQGAGREGIGILVWGDVPTAPRRVQVDASEATFVISGSSDLVEFDLPPVRFAPATLPFDVRNETAAILGVQRAGAEQPQPAIAVEAAAEVKERDLPERARALAAEPDVEGVERRLYLFGGVRAEHRGTPVEGWRRRQALELLAFLAAHPEGRSVDAVAEAIWPEGHARRVRSHLRQLVREARLRLATDSDDASIVVLRDGSYRLDWQSVWVDVEAFRRAIARAARSEDPTMSLREAVSLYRGDFCKDAYYSWSEPIGQELERTYLGAVIQLADRLIERGELQEASPIIDAALAFNPYSDALAQRAIFLDVRRLGARAARERLSSFRERLRADLGQEPDPATDAVLQRVIREQAAPSPGEPST